MFKKAQRINSVEFEGFFSSGRRSHSKGLQMILTPHPTLKVAVVVPKKVVKTAVGRNLLKRQLNHQLKEVLKEKTGVYIFIVKKDFLTITKQERLLEIKGLVGVKPKTS